MRVIAFIPARMGASRFPGKPMAKINNIPMIGHCYFRTNSCKDLDDTYVATCDKEIFDYIKSIGGKAVMTSKKHERASDRIAEAMKIVEKETSSLIDLPVMVQGDEPLVTPEMITEAITPFFSNKKIKVVNLVSEIENYDDFLDPNEIKVVLDKNNYALYFSRAPIPFNKFGDKNFKKLKQVCVIPFKRNFLLEFNSLPQTELEKLESVDMMRVLENGEKVLMVPTSAKSFSVDTEQDRIKVEKIMKKEKNKYF